MAPSGDETMDSNQEQLARKCRVAPTYLETDDRLESIYRGRIVEDEETEVVNVMTFTGEVEEVSGETIENYVAHAFAVGQWAGERGLPAYVFYEADELPLSGAIIAGKPEDVESFLLERTEYSD